MSADKKRILIVGQTPPPYNGQSIMIQKMLDKKYETIEMYHVRMAFSDSINEIGSVHISKVLHLFKVVLKIIYIRFKYGANILYYPPTGPSKVPFFRDVIILSLVRPFFKKTCFHFHAAGISGMYPSLNSISKLMFRLAYYRPTLGIKLSPLSIADPEKLKATKEAIIPYGIEDMATLIPKPQVNHSRITILFVGMLADSKGVSSVISVSRILKDNGLDFVVKLVGEFKSAEYEKVVKDGVVELGLESNIIFTGVLVGREKFEVYHTSDIFFFPSFYESESFPVVLLEACCFALPIVSTYWRGIPSIVEDGENGYLAPVREDHTFAERLMTLINDDDLRSRMGNSARKIYEKKYTVEKFFDNMETALSELAAMQ